MVDFGNKLKSLRTSKGLSQGKLAERLRVTKSMISAYENQIRYPSYDVLLKIAVFFSVSVDYLLGTTERTFLDITELDEKQIAILSDLIEQFKANKK
jgi:transcriptional regulator with XRE-family HTH domain